MTDIEEAFTLAQEAALRASADLAAALNGPPIRVYRSVPEDAQLTPEKPGYLRIGDDVVIDDSTECVDGHEILSRAHLWMKPEPPEAITPRRVAGIVRRLLNADLNIEGHATVVHEFLDVVFITDPDRSTHAVLSFRYLVERV